MKTAISMRYGGLMVDAADCDYTSFKHLGLLCPICKKSVFLVAESQRTAHERRKRDGSSTQVKESTIPTYFSHHPDVGKAEVEACELRSKQITEIQRAYVAAQARGQRQKLLQAHCWKLIKRSKFLAHLESIDLCEALVNALIKNYEFLKQFELGILTSFLEADDEAIFFGKNNILHDIDTDLVDPVMSLNPAKIPLFWDFKRRSFRPTSAHFQSSGQDLEPIWHSDLEKTMQKNIVSEVLDFLKQKRQQPIIRALIYLGIWSFLSRACAIEMPLIQKDVEFGETIKKAPDPSMFAVHLLLEDLEDCDEDEVLHQLICVEIDRYISGFVVSTIVFTDWASEFERLEKLELATTKKR